MKLQDERGLEVGLCRPDPLLTQEATNVHD